jgi:hypothetical protein
MRWPFVESELQNSNLVGWLAPVLTVAACYYVGDTLIGGMLLIAGVVASALLLTWLRRPWWQQLIVLLWSVSPISFVILEARASAHLPSDRPPAVRTQSRSHQR